MQKSDGKSYWWEGTVDGITFTMRQTRSENLGRCYNRYYYRVEADKPFNAAQLQQFVKTEHPYFWYQGGSCNVPDGSTSVEISDTVDSSD